MNAMQSDLQHRGSIRANALMAPYLRALGEVDRSLRAELLAPFRRLLKKGLVKRGEAIVLGCFLKGDGAPPPEALRNLTGHEHAVNRLHVEDYVPRRRERHHLTLLRHALALGDEVIRRIRVLSPGRKIQVTLCFDSYRRQRIAVFSFHLKRHGQELWPDFESNPPARQARRRIEQPCLVMEA